MNPLTRYQNNRNYVALFFTGLFLYFLFVVDPPLYLIKNYREFFTDIYFFKKYFDSPGNPTEYLSRFTIQLYNFPAIGSFIITAILFSIYWFGSYSLSKEKQNLVAPLIPVIILIALHNDYNHSLKFDIEILFTLLISTVYFRIIGDKNLHKFLFYPVLLCVLYFFTGVKTVYLFSILAIIRELFSKGERRYSLVILLETIVVTLLFNHLFFISYKDVFKEVREMQNVYALWFLPFLLYISILLVFIFNSFSNLKRPAIIQPRGNADSKKSILNFNTLLGLLVISLITAVICYFSFDKEQKIKLSVQHYGRNKDWNKVLKLSKQSDLFDRTEIIYTNRALYFTGRIYDDLFKYNQEMGSGGLMATKLASFDEVVPNQDVCLDLGCFSMSVVWGTEATNVYGANPYVLKNLTKAYLAMGCIKEGQKMLNLLDHTLFNKKWSERYRKFIVDTTLINTDPELGWYRKILVPAAKVSMKAIDNNLYFLTGKSNFNKMAYDYLMISAMLDNNMKDFGIGLSGLKFFGYTHIPKLYFEGFIAYSLISDESPINFEEYTYDQDIVDEFNAFQKDYLRLKGNPEEARKYLFTRYGDTYWYYRNFPRLIVSKEDGKPIEKGRE